ncbi:beta-ketoacyl synthase N-terminal-like domain-containing protein [Aquitalea sp. LB_tupeE]|uniref:beta-ketoacyl synthase N-terminal-like domain-containing protein n=1 Tax=Aquitalea sp. LB_tupeE TaxID=2748078 RepID=UPI0015B8A084|nr:beta-ketoacyl synthase N-terminal-like domain-containing protein [Aquitalea sp. LB_tupeE]NWK79674.1 polyketide synthase dehydratase domain-containing protein [Aquitalea sp. LB_tupeE]
MKSPIAIVGVSCQLPGAKTAADFWNNIKMGKRTITRLQGADKQGLHMAVGFLDGSDEFDYERFGITKKEAILIDPQHRKFAECVADALEMVEQKKFTDTSFNRHVGVYASMPMNTYLPTTRGHIDTSLHTLDGLQSTLTNDKDYIALRCAYMLDLRGPAINVQASCASTLISLHQACLALENDDCDMAVVGGATIMWPQLRAYKWIDGSIFSRSGACHPFSTLADGTVHGNGAAVVVLKKLSKAINDNNKIFGIIKATGLNSDGARKSSFTAPSADGQKELIGRVLKDIDVTSIGLLEAHATGTAVGDKVELQVLESLFSGLSPATSYCALGASKPYVGHLEATSGVVSLIKACHSMLEGVHTPDIVGNDWLKTKESPFYLPARLTEWPSSNLHPRRACVSSFGMGGTNAFVLLEEPSLAERASVANHQPQAMQSQPREKLLWSGLKTSTKRQSHENLGVNIIDEVTLKVYEIVIQAESHPWINDHQLNNQSLIPATYYIHLFRSIAAHLDLPFEWALSSVQILKKLILDGPVPLRLSANKHDDSWSLRIESRSKDEWEPRVHATARIVNKKSFDEKITLNALLQLNQEPVSIEYFPDQVVSHGMAFQNLRHAVRTPYGVLGLISDPAGNLKNRSDSEVCLLDSCLQVFRIDHADRGILPNDGFLLTSVDYIDINNVDWCSAQTLWCLGSARAHSAIESEFITDYLFFSEMNGEVVGVIKGVTERKLSGKAVPNTPTSNNHVQTELPIQNPDSVTPTLIAIVSELVGIEKAQIMESDSLESLGVDSFAALELSLTLEQKLGKKINPDDIDRRFSIQQIAFKLKTK